MLFSHVIVVDVSLLNSSVIKHTKIITPQAGINTNSATSIQILSSKSHVYKKLIFLIQLENILKKDLMVLIVILSQIFVAGY
jgi:hypothetical protein